jgi:hypothetical protein
VSLPAWGALVTVTPPPRRYERREMEEMVSPINDFLQACVVGTPARLLGRPLGRPLPRGPPTARPPLSPPVHP